MPSQSPIHHDISCLLCTVHALISFGDPYRNLRDILKAQARLLHLNFDVDYLEDTFYDSRFEFR
jgi:hypothetical protein